MPSKKKEDEVGDDIAIEIEEMNDTEERILELSIPLASDTNLQDVAFAVLEHGDVIDEMFNHIMLPSENQPPAKPDVTIPPPSAQALRVFHATPEEDIIDISIDDEDVILLNDSQYLSNTEEDVSEDTDAAEEAFYRQFED